MSDQAEDARAPRGEHAGAAVRGGGALAGAALAFGTGVGLGAWLPQRPWVATLAAAAALAVWALLLLRRRVSLAAWAGAVSIALVGAARCQTDLVQVYDPPSRIAEGEGVASGRVAGPPARRGGDQILTLAGARVRLEGATLRLTAPIQVVLAGNGERYLPGELLTVRGRVSAPRGDRNLGWFPAPVASASGRVAARVLVRSPVWVRRDGFAEERGPGAAVLRWRSTATAFWREVPGPASSILDALTTGERAEIPEAEQQAFFRSGLTHLLAISGMNVGFLAALVYLVLRRALASWEWLALRAPVLSIAAAACVPALWFFHRFSGSQVPVGRAGLMMAAGLAAVVLWRRVHPGDAIGLAAICILAGDPCALFSASFQLSFAAVAALALVAPRIGGTRPEGEGRVERSMRWGGNLLLVSLAAGGATGPLVAFHFQQVALVGPVANLVAVPWCGFLALPAAWVTLAGRALWGPLGEVLRAVALRLASGLCAIAAFFAAPGWSSLRTPRPPLLATLALTVLVAVLLPPAWRGRRRSILAAAAAALLATGWWAASLRRDEPSFVFFDVGQGMSAAALLPGGASLVADAGPQWTGDDAGRRVVAPALRGLGVSRIDVLALTHAHPDHAGGVASLLEEFPVGEFWVGAGAGPLPADVELAGRMRGLLPRGVRAFARGAQRGLPGGARAFVLNPAPGGVRGAKGREDGANAASLAFLLASRGTAVLVTGDAGAEIGPAAGEAAREAGAPRVVLQAPHHGGSPGACGALEEAVRPEVAVIPVGRNSFGHPRPAAVAALARSAAVYRTDRDGAVFVRCEGGGLAVRTWSGLAASRTWAERLRWLTEGW